MGAVSSAALKDAGGVGEVIFVDTQDSTVVETLPAAVKEAIRAGRSYPLAVISNADGTKTYGTIPFDALKTMDFGKAYRDAKKAMKADIAAAPPTVVAKPAAVPTPAAATAGKKAPILTNLASPEDWTSLQGNKMTAKITVINGDKITLQKADGKKLELTKAQLSAESQAKVAEYEKIYGPQP